MVTAANLITSVCQMYGVRREELADHSRRSADVMDARAAIAWIRHETLGWSKARAMGGLGYAQTSHDATWARLRLRVYNSTRLRAQIESLSARRAA